VYFHKAGNSEVRETAGKDKFLISARQERDSHCMYEYKRNISHNRCRRVNEISVTYSECVYVALGIQDAKRSAVLCCRVWPVRLCHIFLHYFVNGTIFGVKVTEGKMCFRFSVQLFFFLEHSSL
jgi:hypothetical protein